LSGSRTADENLSTLNSDGAVVVQWLKLLVDDLGKKIGEGNAADALDFWNCAAAAMDVTGDTVDVDCYNRTGLGIDSFIVLYIVVHETSWLFAFCKKHPCIEYSAC
jgi:hypothetical protein